jgi:hypothetical protein
LKSLRIVLVVLALAMLGALPFLTGVRGRSADAVEVDPAAVATESVERTGPTAPSGDGEPDTRRQSVDAGLAALDEAGIWVVGEVLSSKGGALQGAAVRVSLRRGLEREVLSRVTTDEAGTYRVDVSSLFDRSAAFVLGAAIAVRASATGHTPSDDEIYGDELGPGENQMDLELAAGPVITGRVVDPKGAPVAGAWVALVRGEEQRRSMLFDQADEDGSFVFGLAGDVVHVQANAGGLGRVEHSLAGIDPSESVDLGDLFLRAEGVIEGRVVCANGEPVPGLAIHASSSDAEANGAWTHTDEHGLFRIAGLNGERYSLRCDSDWIGEAAFPVGTFDAELVVAGHFLWVAVVDEDGVALPGAGLECTLTPPADGTPLDGEGWISTETRGALALALVPVGNASAATLTSEVPGGEHQAEERVELGGGDCVRAHRFVIPVDPPTGRVALALHDESGAAVDDYTIVFSSVATADPLYEFKARDADAAGTLPPVAAGTYHVQVLPGDERSTEHFLLDFELEHDFTVGAGEVHRIEREVATGGRLSVIATCSPAPTHGQIEVSWDPYGTGRTWSLYFRPDGPDAPPERQATNRIVHDRPYISRYALPPGTYPIRVEQSGYDPVELFVTLEAGRVAAIDTLLFPKVE